MEEHAYKGSLDWEELCFHMEACWAEHFCTEHRGLEDFCHHTVTCLVEDMVEFLELEEECCRCMAACWEEDGCMGFQEAEVSHFCMVEAREGHVCKGVKWVVGTQEGEACIEEGWEEMGKENREGAEGIQAVGEEEEEVGNFR